MKVKSFVTLLLVFAWLAPVMAQYDLEAKERERMSKARVKVQTQWTHDFVDGKPSAKGYKSSVTKFNTKGNITEVTNYNEEGKIISLIVYQYDSNRGNKVNFERYQGNREKLQYSQKLVYNAKGNKIKEYGYDGATVYSNTYQYDANDKLSEIAYTVDNALVEKRKLKYAGNKTEIMIYDPSNNLTFRQENSYNDKGLLTAEIKTGGKGNVVHTLDLQYNTSGGLTEEIKKRAGDKLDYQKLYYYDKENRPIKEEIINLDDTKFVSHEYQYDNLGNLILETWRKNEKAKEASSKKIIYDSRGLYTEMECYYATYKLKSLYKYTYELY
ncbi:MAG: hypothetical protein LBL24_01440 [Bacteroidales bacterium]|jgi:YD repeat-containing protein|nr:hypothetical protein [Bacteroidales bacterium]